MTFHKDKSIIIFHRKRITNLNKNFSGLQNKTCNKFLGYQLDSWGNNNDHIEYIEKKIAKTSKM